MKIAISVGDINGVGLEILLRSHKKISKFCEPIYCVDTEVLKQAARLLNLKLPKDLCCVSLATLMPKIIKAEITKESGAYSYASFLKALNLTLQGATKALVTLPIHKKAWQIAGISYAGHTDALRDMLKERSSKIVPREAIMMLGSSKLYVALFTDHIALRDVPAHINVESLEKFLLSLAPNLTKIPCGVLGLNPHAGDFGVLGDEENVINTAIQNANSLLGAKVYVGALVPDTAFIGKHLRYYVAMYHDQGLIPLKTLYFKESINITLNLPIVRTSVDHGTAFDIAYAGIANCKSYIRAVKEALLRVKIQKQKSKMIKNRL